MAAIDDARTHLLRNRYTGPLALVAVAGFAMAAAVNRTGFPAIGLMISLVIFVSPWLTAWLISPASIGFGDVKLSAGLGLYLGWLGTDVAFAGLIATVAMAGFATAVAFALGRGDTLLPFGPALVGGAIAAAGLHILGVGLGA